MGLHPCKQLESLLIVCILLTKEMVTARKVWKTPDYCDDHQQSESDEYVTSFLWSVKRSPPAYFFGTIHVPYTRVWDHIPDNGKRAFEISDNVFFELDLTDPYTISALTNCQLLPHGESLVDVIPKDIYTRLKRHLDYVKVMMPLWITSDQKGRGLYADYLFNAITGNWERKRPVWVMLMVNSLTESDIKSRGIPVLDLYLAQEAERLNKRTGAVEKVEEQCLPLNGLNLSQVVFALNQTLHQHESIRAGDINSQYSTDDLIKHYNCGNLNAVIFNRDSAQVPNLTNVSLAPMEQLAAQKIDDYFREELIYRRNKRMGHRVADLLRAYPDQSFFFAFGAGHFLGNMSVLDFIQQHGYEIEHLPPDKKLKGFGRKHRHRGIVPELKLLKDFTFPVTNLKIDPAISSLMEEKRKRIHPDSWTLYQSYQPALSWGVKSSHFFNERNHKHRESNPHAFPLDSKSTSTKRDRNFNDLWVRLESTASSPLLKRMDPDEAVQQSLRVWYGLPSSGESLYYQQTFLVPILVLCLILCHFGCVATISVSEQ